MSYHGPIRSSQLSRCNFGEGYGLTELPWKEGGGREEGGRRDGGRLVMGRILRLVSSGVPGFSSNNADSWTSRVLSHLQPYSIAQTVSV